MFKPPQYYKVVKPQSGPPPVPIRVYFRDGKGELGCIVAGKAFDHEDAIHFVQEAIGVQDKDWVAPVLAVINGGKV